MYIQDYGIILRCSDFRENDVIAQIYSRKHGIVSACAFGAKKSRKRFCGNLLPYQLLFLRMKSRKELFNIEEINVVRYFPNITKNLTTLKLLLNISNLLLAQRGHGEESLFKLLYFLIFKLNSSNVLEEQIKLYLFFCLYFLKKDGVLIIKKKCVQCNSASPDHMATDNNVIYFKCSACLTSREIYSKIDKDFIEFFNWSVKPEKTFFERSFSLDILKNIENTTLPIIKAYFHIPLELVTP